MRNAKDQVEEIFRRAEILEKKSEEKTLRRLAGAVVSMTLLLACFFWRYPHLTALRPTESVMGAFLLGPEIGGYVTTAIVAFAAGVILTLLVRKRRDQNKKKR